MTMKHINKHKELQLKWSNLKKYLDKRVKETEKAGYTRKTVPALIVLKMVQLEMIDDGTDKDVELSSKLTEEVFKLMRLMP